MRYVMVIYHIKYTKVLRKFYEKCITIMATFKAVVMRHQKRRDGKYPVSIRLTHNKKSTYISTGLYVSGKQINSKTFEIKDQFVLERTNSTIRDYERFLLTYSTTELINYPIEKIKGDLSGLSERIDYFQFCDDFIAKHPQSTQALRHSLRIIKEEMRIQQMYATDFTSKFLREFKEVLDTREVALTARSTGRRKMSQKTKRGYLTALCSSFKRMKEHYNTEFFQRISHDPFIGLERYKEPVTKKKSMTLEELRFFFNYKAKTKEIERALDIMRLSFCLCGMNVADIYTLGKSCYDEETRRITYNRRKTRTTRADAALSSIRLEPEAEEVFNKYRATKGNLLFDFGVKFNMENFSHKTCESIRKLCKKLNLRLVSPLWFRHTWATIARNKCGVSKDDVDLCLNHVGNNPMADVYIDYDWSIIDRANRKVLDYVFHSDKE